MQPSSDTELPKKRFSGMVHCTAARQAVLNPAWPAAPSMLEVVYHLMHMKIEEGMTRDGFER